MQAWLTNLLNSPLPARRERPNEVLEFPAATWNALPADLRRDLQLVALNAWWDGDVVRVEVAGYRAEEFRGKIG